MTTLGGREEGGMRREREREGGREREDACYVLVHLNIKQIK